MNIVSRFTSPQNRYDLVNNTLGWLCFLIAAVTYLLTMEPTASFWDCPEFISQGMKLEVGHPPGNPIFILAARFFVNFAGDPSQAAVAVNTMSALLSAGTILLLFWTITHLVRRLMVGRSDAPLSLTQLMVVMSSGLCGALLYTWSDTFWYSAVEGEVYAFSSFCTALVFWLILKWDNRADRPHSDRYLILVAFIIGVSIGVHLLNLLTIPALGLVIYYRKAKNINVGGSVLALVASFVVMALILYGLVPGFVEIAQHFELFWVNTIGLSYNMGVLIYALLLIVVLIWSISALYRQNNLWEVRISFILAVILSGIPFIGSSVIFPVLIIGGLVVYMLAARKLNIRLLTITALSIFVIFIGYTSYTLLLIRASANPPMNQNAPDNVFTLSSYLNREQYGETPLFYGPAFSSVPEIDPITGKYVYTEGKTPYAKAVKQNPDEPDRYVELPPKETPVMTPSMIFPRMHSSQPSHQQAYLEWVGASSLNDIPIDYSATRRNEQGEVEYVHMPSFAQNLRFFFTYQLSHMYWRYFMWNFAGRQNDIQGQGELNRGNWISGIPLIDNMRLGDQSLLPPDIGSENKGHNVFYMLPLLMGLLGIAAQMMRGNEGVSQFWVVFFLFFMTGIAIVLYLNQSPMQVRERDYAYAGSFYAFSIWIGMGVYALWLIIRACFGSEQRNSRKATTWGAVIACIVGLAVPLQVVSQTWDDHDRSGRYTTRDYGFNYLSSVDENGIIFTNGDNDTFPLWYAQEVEGYRTDVRVVNLSYLTTDWYANHMKMPSYEADAIEFAATPADYAHDRLQYAYVYGGKHAEMPVEVFASLNHLYTSPEAQYSGIRMMCYPLMYIPVSIDDAVNAGVITPEQASKADDYIVVDLNYKNSITLGDMLSLDMIAHGADNGWKRPAYFAMTVPDDYYLNLTPYLRSTGLAYQVTPIYDEAAKYAGSPAVSTEKMYDNVMNKFRWGGLDSDKQIYLDETVRRMVTTHRSALCDLATALYYEGYDIMVTPVDSVSDEALTIANTNLAKEKFQKAVDVLHLLEEKLPTRQAPYAIQMGVQIADLYYALGTELGDESLKAKALDVLATELDRYAHYIPYFADLSRRAKGGFLSLDLNSVDRYIPIYIEAIMQSYVDYNGTTEELEKILHNAAGQNAVNDYHYLLQSVRGPQQAATDYDEVAYEETDSVTSSDEINSYFE